MEKEPKLQFNETMVELVQNMESIRKEFSLKRANGVILLKALLIEKDSVFYDCLCAVTVVNNPYKGIIRDCDKYLKKYIKQEKDIQEDEKPFTMSWASNNNQVVLYLDDDVQTILQNSVANLIEDLEEDGDELDELTLDSEYVFAEFLKNMPKDALNILKDNGVYIEAIMQYYESFIQEYDQQMSAYVMETGDDGKIKLPSTISGFVTDISSEYKDAEDCEILGREKECQSVMRILQKRGRKNVVLLGKAGVGKSAIAKRIAYDIAKGNCPEALKGNIVLQLNVNSSIAGTIYRGMSEERIKCLVEFLEAHDNIILFIDEMHTIIGAGATSSNGENDMANALKPFLASSKSKVIGATTKEEYDNIILRDSAFKRRFQKVMVKEPKAKEVYPMLKKAIEEHEKFHGVRISQQMVEYAILISACFNNNTSNPDRTNDLIDTAMVIAKEEGKDQVDKNAILSNFDINFEKFKNMSKEHKLETAYHEAGHYLLWRVLGIVKDRKGIAISIMPAEEYMGVTVYDDVSDENTIRADRNYYIALLAQKLAGREAERFYTNVASAGADSDLESANKMAYYMITRAGLTSKDGENFVYFEDSEYHMMSEAIRNEIDKQRKEIIKEATELAVKTLNENRGLLDKLANSLVENSILEESELDKIFENI